MLTLRPTIARDMGGLIMLSTDQDYAPGQKPSSRAHVPETGIRNVSRRSGAAISTLINGTKPVLTRHSFLFTPEEVAIVCGTSSSRALGSKAFTHSQCMNDFARDRLLMPIKPPHP